MNLQLALTALAVTSSMVAAWVATPVFAAEPPAKKEATRLQKSERIKPDGVAEACVKLAVGQVVRYRFESDAPLDFNIHAHKGDEVIYPVRQDAITKTEFLDFKPEFATDWCWMWTNKNGTPAEVRYTLFVAPPKRERKK